MDKPTLGRIVIYRSRTGDYDVPAIVTVTTDTLNAEGVMLGHLPPLSSDMHVHLTVFTAGKPGMRRKALDFVKKSQYAVSENVAGCYQEWDIAPAAEQAEAGTWRWPVRA